MIKTPLSQFIKEKRKKAKMRQEDLSFAAGVGLRFVRELEQGKSTLRIDKINQVLNLFGHELGPIEVNRDEKGKSHLPRQAGRNTNRG
ncbi:MAG: helix-turn-helix transcriptional regulator [Ekhidna sp.]|nr:helix-turn-helix transcriptional regulator [Ekhidna sp.]MBC6427001.1 helix-turn-helix transcriptional regulator [Ekhidna sp.]